MEKTQYSFSDDPTKLGAPSGFTLQDVPDLKRESARRTQLGRVVRERVLRLRHAHRCLAQPHRGQLLERSLRGGGEGHSPGPVDLLRDRLDLLPDRPFLVVQRLELRRASLQ